MPEEPQVPTDPMQGPSTLEGFLRAVATQLGILVTLAGQITLRLDALEKADQELKQSITLSTAQCQRVQDAHDQERTSVVAIQSARWAALDKVSRHPAVLLALMALAWFLTERLGVVDYVRALP